VLIKAIGHHRRQPAAPLRHCPVEGSKAAPGYCNDPTTTIGDIRLALDQTIALHPRKQSAKGLWLESFTVGKRRRTHRAASV